MIITSMKLIIIRGTGYLQIALQGHHNHSKFISQSGSPGELVSSRSQNHAATPS